jgi:hypothetical protein
MIYVVGQGIWMLCGVIHDSASPAFRSLFNYLVVLRLIANGAGQEPVAGSPLRNDGHDRFVLLASKWVRA